MKARGTGDTGGFAKLPNELVSRGILAHLPGGAFKVYAALLLAALQKSNACFPSVETLAYGEARPKQREDVRGHRATA
jgi:hypothetical protein